MVGQIQSFQPTLILVEFLFPEWPFVPRSIPALPLHPLGLSLWRSFGAVGVLALLLSSGCSKSQSTAPAPQRPQVSESHARMVAELEKIRLQSRFDNEYFQTASLNEAQSAWKQSGADTPIAERLELLFAIADDSRRLGDNAAAVENLQAALELMRASEFAESQEHLEVMLFELGLSWLRLGETENCIHCRTGESCILPIRGGGIHQQQKGSREAMKTFLKLLEQNPDHLAGRWLLNIAAMTLGEYPQGVPERYRVDPGRFESTVEFPRFRDVAQDAGLKTVNCGGGAIAEDFDNDGLIDILTSTWDPGGQIQFFHNTGNGHFEDRTEQMGLTGLWGGINLVQGDFDNDGWTDAYVVRGAWLSRNGCHPNSLLRNVDGQRFEDVTFAVGLGDVRYPSSTACWADYDNDGDLDLFSGSEGPACQLYRNEAGQRFVDVAQEAGVENSRFTKGSVWGDFDSDGWPDLYVSNLGSDNRLYRNQGGGRFTDVAPQLGLVSPCFSFTTWFWDVNNDGALDLYVGSYEAGVDHVARQYLGLERQAEFDALYMGDGQGGFREAAGDFGLNEHTQPMGANFGDLDNDGFPDFYLGTGYPDFEGLMPNLMFRNVAGRAFENVTFAGGFGHLQKGHGTVFADLDNDGDQDVFIQMGGAYPGDAFGDVLFKNPGFSHHWLRIRLVGRTTNRSAIGARIRVTVRDGEQLRTIHHLVSSGGSFGCNPLTAQLGLGTAGRIEILEIHWPTSGTTQRFEEVDADQFVEIEEHADRYTPRQLASFSFRSTDNLNP